MFQKFKKFVAAATVAVASLATGTVQATFFTGTATMDVNSLSPTQSAPIRGVTQITEGNGQVFVNTYTVGGMVRSVGVLQINALQTTTSSPNGVNGPGNTASNLVVAFALDGHVTSNLPGQTTVQFTGGGFGIFREASGYVPGTASTWVNGVNGSAGVTATETALANNLIYAAAIATPTDIMTGSGFDLGPGTAFSASDVNTSTLNAGNVNQDQTRLLFNSSLDPGPVETALGTQNRFISVDGSTAQLPDQIFGVINQTAFTTPKDLNSSNDSQNVVNALPLLFGLGSVGGASTNGFANFGSSGADGYNVTYTTIGGRPFPLNGDFAGSLSGVAYPGNAVPEPSSMALLATGSLLAGLFAIRRRKNSKMA